MTPLFKKLNFKKHASILCIDAPKSFETALQAMQDFATIITDFKKIKNIEFVIVFVSTDNAVKNAITKIVPLLAQDGILWMCYPKMSSKNFKSTINRDTGWDIMGSYNLEPVRGVAIDDDWSALRFRNVAYIKTMKRKSGALSEAGKDRVVKNLL